MLNKSRYTLEILYHFVGRQDPTDHDQNYHKLHTILSQGCVSHWPHDDPDGWGKVGFSIKWDKSLFSQELIVPYVTCYAEIPFNDLGIHIGKYGHFGLGFEKHLPIYYGARPVIYIPFTPEDRFHPSPYGIHLIQNMEQTFKCFAQATDEICKANSIPKTRMIKAPESPEEAIDNMYSMFGKDFLAFVKVFDCTLPDDDPKNYYMEREWRKYQYLRFTSDQVCKILVARGFGDRLIKEFPVYAGKVIELPD